MPDLWLLDLWQKKQQKQRARKKNRAVWIIAVQQAIAAEEPNAGLYPEKKKLAVAGSDKGYSIVRFLYFVFLGFKYMGDNRKA